MFDWSWWKVAYWLVGTLGITGTIALAVFFPAVFSIAFKAVVRFFIIVLSYRVGCALVAAALAAFVADYHRHSIEDAKHAAELAAFERKQDERDKQIAQDARDLVWKEIADATVANTTTDKEVKEFTDALPPVPHTGDNPFRVGADAAVRLRRIAGEIVGGPERSKRVPAPRRTGAAAGDRREHRLQGAGG